MPVLLGVDMADPQSYRRIAAASIAFLLCSLTAQAQEKGPLGGAGKDVSDRPLMAELCRGIEDKGRVVCADIGALDQTLVYNRFGSFNPFGMIFALDRDLAVLRNDAATAGLKTASDCANATGAEHGHPDQGLSAGNVRLRDCKRPRPLVLRANVDDTLVIRVSNWLYQPQSPDFSRDFCNAPPTLDSNSEAVRPHVSRGASSLVSHGEASCLDGAASGEEAGAEPLSLPAAPDWPNTRGVLSLIHI